MLGFGWFFSISRGSWGWLPALLLALGAAACNRIPAEATAQHQKVVAALSAKDKAAVTALVVPAQRTGPLGMTGGLGGVKSDKPPSQFTLGDVLDIELFSDARTVEVNDDLKTKMSDDTMWLGATFRYADDSFGVRSLVMRQVEGTWLLDMKTTLERWSESGDGFMVISVKK